MKIIYYNDFKKTDKSKKLEGNEDAMFEEFYKLNNRLRYCNGSHWKFENEKNEKEYMDWFKGLSKERSFNLYYGGGVVD